MKDENQNVILQSNVNNSITFTGRRYDKESELYYYRNRMYSPTLGRFMSNDPKGYVDGMNLYAYVKNNPLKYLDAMGTTSFINIQNDTSMIKIGNFHSENNIGSKLIDVEVNGLKAERGIGNTSVTATALSANFNLAAGIKDKKFGVGGSLNAIEVKAENSFSMKVPFSNNTYNVKISGSVGIGIAGEVGIANPTNGGNAKLKLGFGPMFGIDIEWSIK